MTAFLFAVGTGVLAAMLGWLVAHLVRVWQRLGLRRFAVGERRRSRRLLSRKLAIDSRRFSQRQAHLLASTFRLSRDSRPGDPDFLEDTLTAPQFLTHVEEHEPGSIFLVNADTGYGKTILAVTLTLLRSPFSRHSLFPIYIDLAEAEESRPLAELEEVLSEFGSERRLWGRPLILLDALNEIVDPELFAKSLAARRESLTRVGAQLVFLFSFRHRSYPSRLRSALAKRGFRDLQGAELLFEPGAEGDLAFFPELLAGGGTQPSLGTIAGELKNYSEHYPTAPLSREEACAYLRWRYLPSGPIDFQDACEAPRWVPSPSDLCLREVLAGASNNHQAIYDLARVAFLLLGEESTALSYPEIAARAKLSESTLRDAVAKSGLADLFACHRHHLRFTDETTVRVCGAIEVARSLSKGEGSLELGGRTTFDACAPYVLPALRWLQDVRFCPDVSIEGVELAISKALSGRNGPYSFYAGVLCGEPGGLPEEVESRLDKELFEAVIKAIDDNRSQSCSESLQIAGESKVEVIEPILDQLFEVVGIYGRRAVPLLLEISTHGSPLVRSQAVYLMLDWIGRASLDPASPDAEQIANIASGLYVGEENLHVRFHLVEVLERLAMSAAGDETRRQAVSKLAQLASNASDPGREEIYSACQTFLGMRATLLPHYHPDLSAEMHTRALHVAALIRADEGLWCVSGGALSEEQLECWEVALASCAYAAASLRRNVELVAFIEAALGHEYWIVRWWAFNALASVLRSSIRIEDGVLARRCAERLVAQLYTAVEPMGLKHRQCAVLGGLHEDGGEVGRLTRSALTAKSPPRLGSPSGQKLAERYYEAMGASPDHYLAEFSRRLDFAGGS